MSDTTITPESNPTRKQSSLGGNVVKRVVSNTEQQPYLLMATVTKVYYQKGTLDYSSDSTSTLTQGNENYEGQGSAPIPIDFLELMLKVKPMVIIDQYRQVIEYSWLL